MYMAHVCFYVFCSDCVGFCGNVCCLAAVVEDSIFCLGVLKYVVCLCKRCDVCCVFCLYYDVWSCRCSCMGSMSKLSSCRCCMFVSCVHHVVVLNAAFCMTCRLLMRADDGRGIFQSRSHDCLIDNHEHLLCLPHPISVNTFIICSRLCTYTKML